MKHLNLFDFDGTITTDDTLFEIAKFSTSSFNYLFKIILFLPVFAFMKFGFISKQKGKELFLKHFFRKLREESFNKLCQNFAIKRVPDLIRSQGLNEIRDQIALGNRVVIVSASPENWIRPWAEKNNIEVISTRLKFENGRLSGIAGTNCNGEEKVKRIKEAIRLEDYEKVIAYGDTKGDHPMLALAHESHYKPFR